MVLTPPREPLADDVVRLRPLEPGDLPGCEALAADPGVQRYTRFPDPQPPGFAQRWLDGYVDGWRTGARGGFAVEDHDGAFLGFAGLVKYDVEAAEGEIGYMILPAARGRGVAGRALALLTAWALGDGGVQRVELVIDPTNAASLRIAERAGYVREGVRRGSLMKDGQPRVDVTIWSRLPRDEGR